MVELNQMILFIVGVVFMGVGSFLEFANTITGIEDKTHVIDIGFAVGISLIITSTLMCIPGTDRHNKPDNKYNINEDMSMSEIVNIIEDYDVVIIYVPEK